MAEDRRVTFVRKWSRRSADETDPFDQFFAAWIALVVAAQILRDHAGAYVEDDSDRQRLIDYFSHKESAVLRALHEREDEMRHLARRRGTQYGNPIVDTGNPQLRSMFDRLSKYYTQANPMSDGERVKAVAELLNRVRNNVFHGMKIYDDRDDVNLLKLVNPVLIAVLRHGEPSAV